MRKPVFRAQDETFLTNHYVYVHIFNHSGFEMIYFYWIIYIFLFANAVVADLPSCIRAKCSHCKVPFIAQMCPFACSGCPIPTDQNILTSVKQVKNLRGESYHASAQPQIKVPFAQEIPRFGSSGNLLPSQSPNIFQQPAQQTTNFGGSYGQIQENAQGLQFNNPFQPFLQQSFQTAQQIQPNTNPFGQTLPASGQQTATLGYSPESHIQQQNGQYLSQIYQLNQPLQNMQPQQAFTTQTQPLFSGAQQFAQNGIRTPIQPVLHAVPNVIEPQFRPQQPYQIPTYQVQRKWTDEKIIHEKVPTGEMKKPNSIAGIYPGTCPKANWEPCVPKDIANKRFQNCCSGLGEGCSQLCSYDQNLTTIQLAVLTGRCPVNKVADMMICASGYEDATACCQAFGVFEPGFEHCRPYCFPSGGLPNDGNLAEKYRCLQKLQQISNCFYLTQRP